jgi:hypothetical protein
MRKKSDVHDKQNLYVVAVPLRCHVGGVIVPP